MSDQGVQPLFSVGERNYDAESAKTKIINADQHINTIETENATLKQQLAEAQAQLDQSVKLEEALAKLKEQPVQTPATPTAQPEPVDVEALKQQILQQAQDSAIQSINQVRAQEIATANETESMKAAQRLYGSEFETKLREKGAELGMNDEAIRGMAKSNPVLFKKAFGLEGNHNVHVNPDGSVNPAGLSDVKTPEIKSLSKQWGSSAKVEALNANVAAVDKLISDHGGDVQAAARALGVDIKNFVR